MEEIERGLNNAPASAVISIDDYQGQSAQAGG
jgi:hypothetical protein